MYRQVQVEWWRPDVAVEDGERAECSAATAPDAAGSSVPFYALMIFTFILLFAPQNHVPALASLRIALLTAVCGIAAYLFDKLRRGQSIMMHAREMRIIACIVVWAALTVPFSSWPGGSLSVLFGDLFKTLVIFWLLSHTVNTLARLRQIAWGLSLLSLPLTVTAVHNFQSGEFLVAGEQARIVGSDAGLTNNPNDLALMLNLILPLSVALFLLDRRPLARTVLLTAILLTVIAVIFTYSRAGFLTLATSFVTYFWKLRDRPERRWLWVALVATFLCVPFLPSSYLDRLSTITSVEADRTGSSQERLKNTMVAVRHVIESPLVGAGLGMNILAMNEGGGATWTAVHNVYLEYAVDLGIPGLVLFILLLVDCIKNAAFVQQCTARIPAFRELFSLAEGIQVSLIAFSVAGFFHPVAYHFYFYYIAGLAVAVRSVCEQETERGPRASIRSVTGEKGHD